MGGSIEEKSGGTSMMAVCGDAGNAQLRRSEKVGVDFVIHEPDHSKKTGSN